jgi:hypothetical protein
MRRNRTFLHHQKGELSVDLMEEKFIIIMKKTSLLWVEEKSILISFHTKFHPKTDHQQPNKNRTINTILTFMQTKRSNRISMECVNRVSFFFTKYGQQIPVNST